MPNNNPSGAGAFDFPLRLSNYYADRETGMLYAMQRDCYDPVTGRFCESDPIGIRGGINTYAYVHANPLLFVDTDGLRIGGLPSQSPEDLLKGGPERQGQQLSGKAMGIIYGTQCALGCKQGRVQWVVDNALMTCLEIIPAGIFGVDPLSWTLSNLGLKEVHDAP